MPKASKHKLYTLPSNFNEMNKFIEVNKIQLMEHIVASIEYAIDKKLSFVEIFSFKNSDFVVTLPTNQFKENLDNVYSYYIEKEQYELCIRVKSVESKLNSILDETSQELDILKNEISGFENTLNNANDKLDSSIVQVSTSVEYISEASSQLNSLLFPIIAAIGIIVALQITIIARRRY